MKPQGCEGKYKVAKGRRSRVQRTHAVEHIELKSRHLPLNSDDLKGQELARHETRLNIII